MLRCLCRLRRTYSVHTFRSKHLKLSPLADAFNYGPNNVEIRDGKVTGLFGFDHLSSPNGFQCALDDCYCNAHMLLYELKTTNRKRKMVQVLDDLSDTLCRAADLADCVRALHPDKDFKKSANDVWLRVSTLVESLNTDTDLYQAAASALHPQSSHQAMPDLNVDEVDKRVLKLFVEDFEQSGVHLHDSSDRESFLKAAENNMELSVRFNHAAHKPVTLNSEILTQISADVDWSKFDGRKLFSPFYDAPQSFLRALTYALFHGPVEDQEGHLINLLDARHEMARAAGKESYLHRAISSSSLAETPERVAQFLSNVAAYLSPVAQKSALQQLTKGFEKHDRLHPWDIPYLIRRGQYCEDSGRLLPYLSVGACMEGVNQLADGLFGLRLEAEPALPGEVWHSDVVKIAAYTTEPQTVPEGEQADPWEARHPIGHGVRVGTIYCDFFERPGKVQQDCHYTVQGGRHTENTMHESDSPYQYPIVVLQLNLGNSPAESRDGVPALLQPSQIENLFHEWGHALHSVLGRTRFQHVTGTRCSTDLAELPSTLMEYFALDARVTAQYARHFESGESPSLAADVQALLRLNTSRGYGQSVETMQQLMYSMLDQCLHSGPPSKILKSFDSDTSRQPSSGRLFTDIFHEHCDAWWSDELPPRLSHMRLAPTHRFSHLSGYGGRYYAYLMARAGAGLVWRKGFEADPWNSTFGRKYRDTILRFGGERPPAEMLATLIFDRGATDAGTDIILGPEQLARGLCEDIEASEETARRISRF